MKENCAFTIVAKNYIGLALTLENSVKKYNNIDFFIIVSDIISKDLKIPENIIEAYNNLDIDKNIWYHNAFKYNVTEFATFIKPRSFKFLFNKGYNKIIYLDPDILCFNSFDSVFSSLDNYEIIVSPHITTIEEENYSGDLPENIFLGMGIYNLGFLGLKKSNSNDMLLEWWHRVLRDECFMDIHKYTATDQKWMNYLSIFFEREKLLISRELGIDMAPWNFYERKIVEKDKVLYVENRILKSYCLMPLIFVHFSGYSYKDIMNGKIEHKSLKHEYNDINILFEVYQKFLLDNSADKFLNLTYTYNYFENNKQISLFNRRLYRRCLIENLDYGNPFEVKSKFYQLLDKHNLISKSNFQSQMENLRSNKHRRTRINRFIDTNLRLLKNILGIDRYIIFCKYLNKRLLPENQLFLISKKFYENYN